MVGREVELAQLVEAFESSKNGEPRAVIIRGEAGIGKTRLIDEFLTLVEGRDDGGRIVVATGQCIDLGTIGAPFTPIRRMLHELHAGFGDEAFRAALGGAATLATIGTLVPELGAEAPSHLNGGASYVAEAIERTIERLSAEAHIVIVLEDLHWVDTATLDLLKTLVATLRGSHVTLIATYRTDYVGRAHPLRAVVAELVRSRAVSCINVARLGIDGVGILAQELGGGTLTTDQVDTVLARSEGVPFFVEELIRLCDQPLPETLRDVVLARYERLSSLAKGVVGVLAVGGVHLDHHTLQRAWPLSEGDLAQALREAVADGIVASDGDGYTFRHALIREAVYDDLLPQERATAHRAIAGILQSLVDNGRTDLAGTVAEHWLAVHDAGRAFDAIVIAGARARADFAPETAARLGERLLALWPAVDDPEGRAGESSAGVAARIADDYVDGARSHAAMRIAESGLAAAPQGALIERARLHLAAADAFFSDTGKTAVAHLESIEALLGGLEDPQARGLLARARSMLAFVASGREQKLTLANEALVLAEGTDDVDTLSSVLRRRATVLQQLGDHEGSLAATRRSFELSPVGSSTRLIGYINMCDALRVMGRFADSIDIGFEGLAEAVESGQERGYGTSLHANLADTLIAVGRVDEGLAHARRASTLLRGESARWLAVVAIAEAWVGVWSDDLETYEKVCEDIRPTRAGLTGLIEDAVYWQVLALDAAAARATTGRTVVGTALLADAVAQATSLFLDEIEAQPEMCRELLVSGGRALAALAQAGQSGDPRLAARLEEIRAIVERDHVAKPYALVGEAFLREASGDPRALDSWRAAVLLAETGSSPVGVPVRIVHEARFRLALALSASGQRAEAIALLRRVMEEAPHHGIGLVARWARAALTRLGAGGAAPSGPFDELTARELEVLALVAEGLTNRDIGARLYMSPKTASVHVSAILAKFGARNRAEAAAAYTSRLTSESR